MLSLEGWAREGLTDKQIAEHKIGINEATFCRWKDKYPTILQALKKGKAPVDFNVENALLKSALGYYVTIRKPVKVKTIKRKADGTMLEEEHVEYAEEQQYIAPQTAAQIFWLKNRKPDKWRDKPEPPVSSEALERLDAVLENIKGVI